MLSVNFNETFVGGFLAISDSEKLNISMFNELFNQRDPFGSCLNMYENVQSPKLTYPTVYGIIHKDINTGLKYTVSLSGRHELLEVSNVPTYISLYFYCLLLTHSQILRKLLRV